METRCDVAPHLGGRNRCHRGSVTCCTVIRGGRGALVSRCVWVLQVSEFGGVCERRRFVFRDRAKEPGISENGCFTFIKSMKMILTTENRTFHDEDAKLLTFIIFHCIYNRIITQDRSNQNEAIMFLGS